MTIFLWIIVGLGVSELFTTLYYATKGEVPERTPASMAWNAFCMFALAMWAFMLVVGR